MLDFMKVEIKSNAFMATSLRLQEKKAIDKARFFKIISDREGEETKESKFDALRSSEYYNLYQNLRMKRVHELRKTQRMMFLAYGFLRGWDYEDLEGFCHDEPDFNVVEKYIFFWNTDEGIDPRVMKQEYEMWVQEATDYMRKKKGKKG